MWPCIAYWGGESHQNRWGRTARYARWDCQMLVSVCTPSEGPCDLVLSEQWAQDFHDFSFVWTETALDFFLDGVHVNHIATSVLDARARPLNPWSAANPLPMQMRLNLAIPPGTEWNTASWPFLLEVDYVRYYGLPPPPAPPPDSPPVLPPPHSPPPLSPPPPPPDSPMPKPPPPAPPPSMPPPHPPLPPRPPFSPPEVPLPPTAPPPTPPWPMPPPPVPPPPMPPALPPPLLPVAPPPGTQILTALLMVLLGGGVFMTGWRWWRRQGGNRDNKQRFRLSAPSQGFGKSKREPPRLNGAQRAQALLSNVRGARTATFACLNAQADDCSVLEDGDSDVNAAPQPDPRLHNGHSKQASPSKPARIGPAPSQSKGVEERRYDVDGLLYSKAEFIEEYGGGSEWNKAKRQAVQPTGPPTAKPRATAQLGSSKQDSVKPSPAPKQVEERRYDVDGALYTKAEFIEEYGGTSEWDQARSRAPAEPSAAPPLPPKHESTSACALSMYNERMRGDAARGSETSGDRKAGKCSAAKPGPRSGGLLKIKTPLASDAPMPRVAPPTTFTSPIPVPVALPKPAARSSGQARDTAPPRSSSRFIAELD